MEIFERELDEFAENMRSELEGTGDPQDQLERFFRCYAEFGEENEFIQQVFLRGDYRDVIGDLSSEQIADLERKELEVMVPPLEEIQRRSDGPISETEPLTVLGIMGSSLGLLVLHRDEFEEYTADLGEHTAHFEELQGGVYSHLRDVLITTLARGLTVEDERE